jgi:hypothetical protein
MCKYAYTDISYYYSYYYTDISSDAIGMFGFISTWLLFSLLFFISKSEYEK